MVFIPDAKGDPSGATLTRAMGISGLAGLRVALNAARIEAEGQTPIVIARQAFVESLPVRFIGEATAEFVQALEHINLLFSLVPAAPGGSLDSNMNRAQKGTLPRHREPSRPACLPVKAPGHGRSGPVFVLYWRTMILIIDLLFSNKERK